MLLDHDDDAPGVEQEAGSKSMVYFENHLENCDGNNKAVSL